MVFDGTASGNARLKTSFDGAEKNLGYTGTPPATRENHSAKFTIGNGTKGTIDDVRIYNRALSASEVQTLYNMGR